MRENMFNQYQKIKADCSLGDSVYNGWPSYIHMVKWSDFIENINYWVTQAENIQNNRSAYDVKVNMPHSI